MDKGWMHETDRTSTRYSEGVKQFINMARGHADRVGRIKCPCRKCTNRYYHHIDAVETHLIVNRFDLNYTEWIFHGEEDPFFKHVQAEHNDDNSQAEDIDDVGEMLDDIYRGTFPDANIGESSTSPGSSNNDYKARPFDQLWEDAQLWSCEERNSDRCQGERDVGLSVFSQPVRPLGAPKYVRLDDTRLTRARWYVLSNCSEIDSYKTEHYLEIQGEGIIDIDHKHEVEFENWFHNRILTMKKKHIVMTMFQAQIRKKIYLAMMNLVEILGMKIKLSFEAG
ncbi:hypothetical protein CMV_014512 [Castanea mollissima]|uniref:Transposase-associated domain-containing protein n=1 Tax=Castanea mollissima TaxID=60419 RepID=A0A8J4QXI9_9ROSI|nr:hypothetical protein CMV_014512 [Castanea mollissima]